MEEGLVAPLSYGENAVNVKFNPSQDPTVQLIKELYAQIIDLCNEARLVAWPGEKWRILSVAITEAQTAQMWAVKWATYTEE